MLRYWQTSTKYYAIQLYQDLLGDWNIHKTWGSRFTKHGNNKSSIVGSRADAIKLISKIERIRKSHGYHAQYNILHL